MIRPQSARTRWLERLLHLHDTPERTAAAFALGVFFSFSPFVGLQILVSFTLAFLLRLNRVAVFVGLNANLPWIVAPWYAVTTLAAARLMGVPLPADFRVELGALFAHSLLSREFWTRAGALVEPFLVPFLIGPTVGAAAIGAVTYVITSAVLRRRRRQAPPMPTIE
jgi:uncharacterized protein (DUF2062 family)